VDVVLGLLVLAMGPLALCAVVVPLVVLVSCRRRVVPALLLYVAALGLLTGWVVAANAHMDWADRTGGQGSALAGIGWFLGAMIAAGGVVVLATRRPPAAPSA
jgi:peptidoglycan/LPS O-acetylase OafA/YrhL